MNNGFQVNSKLKKGNSIVIKLVNYLNKIIDKQLLNKKFLQIPNENRLSYIKSLYEDKILKSHFIIFNNTKYLNIIIQKKQKVFDDVINIRRSDIFPEQNVASAKKTKVWFDSDMRNSSMQKENITFLKQKPVIANNAIGKIIPYDRKENDRGKNDPVFSTKVASAKEDSTKSLLTNENAIQVTFEKQQFKKQQNNPESVKKYDEFMSCSFANNLSKNYSIVNAQPIVKSFSNKETYRTTLYNKLKIEE